jgi:hypothetical protein
MPEEADIRKYNLAMTVAKEIAQRVSVNAERYDGVLMEMEARRDSLMHVVHGEIRIFAARSRTPDSLSAL